MLEGTKLTAAQVMTRDVATVFPHTSLRYVAKLLAERRISGCPVVDEAGRLAGMVSEADLVRWHDHGGEKQAWWLEMLSEGFNLQPDYLDFVRSEEEKVRTVMTTEVVAVGPDTPLPAIARLMESKLIKRVPVLDNGRLVGIVSRADLVRALANS